MKLTLPIYKKIGKKTVMIGLNWYRNAHFRTNNSVKKYYEKMVHLQLKKKRFKMYEGLYQISYKLYYKNKISDLGNVCSVIDKYVQDSLQSIQYIKNDNIQFCKKIIFEAGEQDKEEPRVEVTFKKIK